MSYTPTIGLEIHAELATETKMFCGCKNNPHIDEVNSHTCPVCMGHPGTLPVPNKEAVAMLLRFGQAIGAERATYSEFDRKNYFYPDIPKAYQISQYKFPFLVSGEITGVQLTRVHLEEDTARSSHDLADASIVDFNRAGVPLMELVTEPVIKNAAQAVAFARELQLILQTLGVSHANMERGEMRIEANVSVSSDPTVMSKTYAELKNINSFKAVEAAIEYEISRQTELLEAGESVKQETRGWDENKTRTFSQRSKETAKDYRYFPDPDIPKLSLDEIEELSPEILADKIPDLPSFKREKYRNLGLTSEAIEIIIADRKLDHFFLEIVRTTSDKTVVELASRYMVSDVMSLSTDDELDLKAVDTGVFVELMQLTLAGDIGSRVTKDLLPKLPEISSVRTYAEEHGLMQLSDQSALATVVADIVANHPDQVEAVRGGKEAVLKFLVGQGMKATKGAANPQALEELLRSEIIT